jgi:DNA-binding transcriptional ArsR family regulator
LANWSLLTNHARLLLVVYREPGLRQRDIAVRLGLTERSVASLVRDLREAGYLSAHREGRQVAYMVVRNKPVLVDIAGSATVGQFLELLSGTASEPPAGGAFRAYYMRLRVVGATEAAALARALDEQGAVVLEQEAGIVAFLWPATEADEPDEWDERTFAEAIFFLRAWSNDLPQRELTVLEERPVDVPEEALRRAS